MKLPREEVGEIFGIVESMLAVNRVKVRSTDSKTRMGRILGKLKKRVWLRVGNVIVIVPWAFNEIKQTSYKGTAARKLNG